MKQWLIIFLWIGSASFLEAQIDYDTLQSSMEHKDARKSTIGLSLHSGYYKLMADVDGSGLGYGIRLNIPANGTLSMRLNLFRSSATGLSVQPWTHASFDGPLVDQEYSPYSAIPDGWFPSYKFTQTTVELEGLLNVIKLLNKQLDMDFEAIDLYVLGSIGLFNKSTRLDLLDKNGLPYYDLLPRINWTFDKYDSKQGRKEIRASLSEIYDGNYETEKMIPQRVVTYSYGAGIKIKASPKINLGAEHKIIAYNNFDYGDGLRYISSGSINDSASYTSVFLEWIW